MMKPWPMSQSANTLLPSHLLPLNISKPNLARFPSKPGRLTCLLKLGVEDIVEITHNKVLIAAGVSAAIGQLSKPFASVILYGKDLDFKIALQAGGFPSTHSSSVVAAATVLALERGFADSIFGLSLVYAGLVMYDSQGVRREVGNHARVLNKLPVNSISKQTMNASKAFQEQVNQNDEVVMYKPSPPRLKESVGHTEVEVVAGGLLGFFVGLAVLTVL